MNSSMLSWSDNKMQKDLLLIVHFAHLHSHVRVIVRLKGDIKDTGKKAKHVETPNILCRFCGKCEFVPGSHPVTQRDDYEALQTAGPCPFF